MVERAGNVEISPEFDYKAISSRPS